MSGNCRKTINTIENCTSSTEPRNGALKTPRATTSKLTTGDKSENDERADRIYCARYNTQREVDAISCRPSAIVTIASPCVVLVDLFPSLLR